MFSKPLVAGHFIHSFLWLFFQDSLSHNAPFLSCAVYTVNSIMTLE